MADNNYQDVEPPWKRADTGSIWCKYQDLPDDIRSKLKLEDGSTETIDEHSYHLKRYDTGDVVFRNPSRIYKASVHRISEIKIKPVEEANRLLANNSDQFELVGMDPIKVINGQFFVALGKKEKV
jgi:hypothetical protein